MQNISSRHIITNITPLVFPQTVLQPLSLYVFNVISKIPFISDYVIVKRFLPFERGYIVIFQFIFVFIDVIANPKATRRRVAFGFMFIANNYINIL
jgi:hypothetical protein